MTTTTKSAAAIRRASSKAVSAKAVKPRRESPMMAYPPYQDYRGGCKVSWYYYADSADAEKAAEAARHNARYLAGQGYDFGYQSPGCRVEGPIKPESWGGKYTGLYEVCIP